MNLTPPERRGERKTRVLSAWALMHLFLPRHFIPVTERALIRHPVDGCFVKSIISAGIKPFWHNGEITREENIR